MAYLTRSEMIDRITVVLKEYGDYVEKNKGNYSWNEDVTANSGQYRNITRKNKEMRNMLRKLKGDALAEMYKKCGMLAEKHKLKSEKTMTGYDSVNIKEAMVENGIINIDSRGYAGWEHQAPQAVCGYTNRFDTIANKIGFNIHATRFVIGRDIVLRLWKGYYGMVIGGEIGFYGSPRIITNMEMKERLCESIKQFLALIGVKDDIERLAELLPEELRKELIRLLLTSSKVNDNNNRTPSEQNFIKSKIRELLSTPKQYLIKLSNLLPLVPLKLITYIIIINRIINFIVEVRELLTELTGEEQSFSSDWGHSLTPEELDAGLGLTGTAIQVRYKKNDRLLAEHEEYDAEYWTTTFAVNLKATKNELRRIEEIKDKIYTINYFYFKNKECTDYFFNEVKLSLGDARKYDENKTNGNNEIISIPNKQNDTTVIILYGKEA